MSKDMTPCCNAAYGIGGKGMTHWYQCTACGKPLDPPGGQPAYSTGCTTLTLSQNTISHV